MNLRSISSAAWLHTAVPRRYGLELDSKFAGTAPSVHGNSVMAQGGMLSCARYSLIGHQDSSPQARAPLARWSAHVCMQHQTLRVINLGNIY